MVSSTRPFDPAIRPCLCMPRTAGHQTPAPLPPRALHDTRRRDTRHQTPESHARMWAPSTHRRAPDTRHQTLIQKGAEHSPACTRHQTPDTRHQTLIQKGAEHSPACLVRTAGHSAGCSKPAFVSMALQ